MTCVGCDLTASNINASSKDTTMQTMEDPPSSPPNTGNRWHIIPMQDCRIELHGDINGREQAYPPSPVPYATYYEPLSEGENRNYREVKISFECHPVRASMFCPNYLSRNAKETDPVMIRDTQQKHLTRLHPIYWAEGYLNTGTAMSVPRTRELNFCLGDDKHSLTGRSVVGLEPREPWDTHGTPPDPQSEIALPAVLDLIRSIRFEEPVVDD